MYVVMHCCTILLHKTKSKICSFHMTIHICLYIVVSKVIQKGNQ